jgi:CheY-like chemotaxis protein
MADPPTIVVIDDQIGVCRSIEKVLGRKGYRVESFLDGGEALARLKAGGVDLVISDMMMPERTGLDILKQMQAAALSAPMIVITGYGSIANSLESLCVGAVDYLPKPFTTEELHAAVLRGLCAARVDASTLPAAPRGTLAIRNHTWARRTADQQILVGLHPFKLRCCGAVRGLELPHEGDELIQGGTCGKLLCDDGPVPLWLWCPVSGQVRAVHRQLIEQPALLTADPYEQGWLLRMLPYNLEKDLNILVEA